MHIPEKHNRLNDVMFPNKVFFSVSVLDDIDGNKLKALRPDADGYYKVCVAVLGEKSRNGPMYDVDSIVKQINTDTIFHKALVEGNLYGEWGHPPYDAPIERIDVIMEDRISHHIKRLFTGEPLSTGGIPIFAELKPSGKYGPLLEKSLLSKYENTAFSLRSLITQKYDSKLKCPYRTVIRLVTFDFVGMPGYLQASKWFSPATESYNEYVREITPEMLFKDGQRVALESFSDNELLDIFGIQDITLNKLKCGSYVRGSGTFFDNNGNKKSLTHALLSR